MIKGEQKQVGSGEKTKYVGFVPVAITSKLAINPTADELNKLFGREEQETDKETNYVGEDKEGNERVKLIFYLYSEDRGRFFYYSFNLTNKEVPISVDKGTYQWMNSTCDTTWVDEEANLPQWFTHFVDRKTGEVKGKKVYRRALLGESELYILLKSWLGKMRWTSPNIEVMLDMNKLFKGDVSELRGFVENFENEEYNDKGLGYDTPFIALLGVETKEDDKSIQYQKVSGKGFLPINFLNYIQQGNKFPSGYAETVWNKFYKNTVVGKYPFKAYFELVPICEYDRTKDPTVSEDTKKKEEVTAVNPKF